MHTNLNHSNALIKKNWSTKSAQVFVVFTLMWYLWERALFSGEVVRGYVNVCCIWSKLCRISMLNVLDGWLDVMHNFLMFARFPIEFIVNKMSVSCHVTYYFVVSHVFTLTHRSTLQIIRRMEHGWNEEWQICVFPTIRIHWVFFQFIRAVLVIIKLKATSATTPEESLV